MASQASEDQAIHQRAVNKGKFGELDNQHLLNNMNVKERFKAALEKVRNGGTIEPKEKRELISLLEKDRASHSHYLNTQNFHPTTGSADWHQAWIQVYDQWLTWLKGADDAGGK